MLRAVRLTSVILTALAVLVVSATCTTAGCVLPGPREVSSATAEPPCCADDHPDHALPDRPSQPKGGERCPLCRTTLLVVKSVDPGQHAPTALTLLPVLFLPPSATVDDCSPLLGAMPNAWDAFTAHDPPTLFALHCALLN